MTSIDTSDRSVIRRIRRRNLWEDFTVLVIEQQLIGTSDDTILLNLLRFAIKKKQIIHNYYVEVEI